MDASSTSSNDRLAHIVIMQSIPSDERIALARECTWHKYSRGQNVFGKDSASRDVMFVVRGRVQVIDYALSGREIAFAELSEGDFFGELAAIDGEPRSASVTASVDCELASLSPSRFDEVLRFYPDVAIAVIKKMCGVIRRTGERLMDLSSLNARQRICMEILRMAHPNPAVGGQWVIHPLPTQASIASRVGTSRETVGRVISDLVHGDIVRKKGRTVTIMNRDRLELHTRRLGDEE